MRHPLINRTSPYGEPFLGTCAACDKAGLRIDDDSECENVRGMTDEQALIEALIDEPRREEAEALTTSYDDKPLGPWTGGTHWP